MIILGGSLSRLGDLVINPIQERINSTALVKDLSKTQLRRSELEPKGIAIGAATLAIEQAFSYPKILRKNLVPAVMN